MKKLLCLLPISILLITGCTKSNEIKGTLPDDKNDGKIIYLYQSVGLDKPFEKIDSTTINKGAFSFKSAKSDKDKASMAYLSVKSPSANIPEIIPFISEAGVVDIKIDTLITLSGTPLNETFQKFMNKMRSIDKQMYDLSASSNNPDVNKMKSLYDQQSGVVYNFLKSNIKNQLGEFMLVNYVGMINIDQVQELVKETSPELQAQFKPYLDQMQSNNPSMTNNSFVGKKYTDITGNTPDGKKIALSDYVGKNKLVLVDFWASWCAPCIQEMPNVVQAYSKYRSKGFEIIGVSLDDKKDDWTKAVTKLNMTWPQISDLKGWESKLSAAYNVESIPFTILIDKSGNIIAQDLRGDELEKKLAEILK